MMDRMAKRTKNRYETPQCPQCHSSTTVKHGKKYNGLQNYLCKDCGRQFICGHEKTYQGCIPKMVNLVKIMLVRGIGIRDINAILKVLKILASAKYRITATEALRHP